MSDTTMDLRVTHPLDDEPEAKLYRPELGRMRMTRPVRVSLLLLRGYLVLMLLLLAARVAGGV
ncbi:MAG: hypothetical protein JO118_12155 [Acetobacteraceae bacterium]|nr:hypothetical protein [Acetobacteraceae bacterium]MBV9118388.1 hypothetical protein [Acetobacteraceae bacterium]